MKKAFFGLTLIIILALSISCVGVSADIPATDTTTTSKPADPITTGTTTTTDNPITVVTTDPVNPTDPVVVDPVTPDPTKVSYSIIFNANSGIGTMENQIIVEGTIATIKANTFTKTGYTFSGWTISDSATTAEYPDGASFTMGTTNVTLFAVWKEETISLTFSKAFLFQNHTAQLVATTTSGTLTYASSNISVATVNSSGLITATGKGNAIITVTTSTGNSTNCTVSVRKFDYKPSIIGDTTYGDCLLSNPVWWNKNNSIMAVNEVASSVHTGTKLELSVKVASYSGTLVSDRYTSKITFTGTYFDGKTYSDSPVNTKKIYTNITITVDYNGNMISNVYGVCDTNITIPN